MFAAVRANLGVVGIGFLVIVLRQVRIAPGRGRAGAGNHPLAAEALGVVLDLPTPDVAVIGPDAAQGQVHRLPFDLVNKLVGTIVVRHDRGLAVVMVIEMRPASSTHIVEGEAVAFQRRVDEVLLQPDDELELARLALLVRQFLCQEAQGFDPRPCLSARTWPCRSGHRQSRRCLRGACRAVAGAGSPGRRTGNSRTAGGTARRTPGCCSSRGSL